MRNIVTSENKQLLNLQQNYRFMKIKKNIAISESGFLFDSNTGESFSLNETGKEIIQLLKDEKTDDVIINYFIENYEVDKATIENNLYDFMTMLQNFRIAE